MRGDEEIHVDSHGHDAVRLTVVHPEFGRIAAVRLDLDAAAELAGALTGLLLDRHGLPERDAQ